VHSAIRGSHFELIRGMGHDIPQGLWPRFVSILGRNFQRAGMASAA
jgi:hypothetical protein